LRLSQAFAIARTFTGGGRNIDIESSNAAERPCMHIENLHTERDRVSADVRAIKAGAAEISQLLAEEVLGGDDWERAVGSSTSCA
jgi:hypothetical protein